jgi:hypothetical protein
LYALALQVDPDLASDQFWELAFQTGKLLEVISAGRMDKIDKLIYPQAIIAGWHNPM